MTMVNNEVNNIEDKSKLWRDKKNNERKAVYDLAAEALKEVIEKPEKFKDYLDTQSRMNAYSVTNALLISKQMPAATQLNSYEEWSKDEVYVKKGAKSISILEPTEYTKKDGTQGIAFNVKKVFDVSQTSGKQTPAPTANKNPKSLIVAMIDTSPVEVAVTNEMPFPNIGAFYDNEKKKLLVRDNIGDTVALYQSLSCEMSHAQFAITSDVYDRSKYAFQALCSGYMLCKKNGIETQPFGVDCIPKSWSEKKPEEVKSELTKSRTVFKEINSRVVEELMRKTKERTQEKER